jgi:hypothetical protein
MADSEPFLLRTWFELDDFDRSVELGEGSPSCTPLKLSEFKSNGFTFTEDLFLDAPTLNTPDSFLSLSLEESFEVDFVLESPLLLDGELAALFNVDMLGLPEPLVEGCFGEVP